MASSTIIGWFETLGLADRAEVGGKGGSLGELTRAGIAVPAGFVIRTAAFTEFLATLESEAPVRARIEALRAGDLAAIEACSAELRARFLSHELPATLAAELAAAHATLRERAGAADVAVRSSATTEDAADASFAGLQDTYLWVSDSMLLTRVRACWASLYSVESISYRRDRGITESDVAMAVVVQSMVDARAAGVMFTRSPTSGDRSVVTIEGSWGLGSAVVGGEVTPDRWVVGKITGEISVREISDKHIEHRRAREGGVRDRSGSRRAAPHGLSQRCRDRRAAADRTPGRASLRLRPGHRMGDRLTRRVAPVAEPSRDRVVGERGATRGAPRRGSAGTRDVDLRRAPMTLTARDIAEITRLLEDSSFDELDLEIDGLKIHLRRSGAPPPRAATPTAAAATRPANTPAAPAPARAEDPSLVVVRAPLLGTFYRAPRPGAPPFVEVGASVEPDTTVGIIEVMKLMNTVRAGARGVVREIRARDGVLVEYGETLLTLAQEPA